VLDRAQKSVTRPYRRFLANTVKEDTSNNSTGYKRFEKGRTLES
jgi:hypothetical protein